MFRVLVVCTRNENEFVSRQQIVPLYILLVPISSCADVGFILLQKRDQRKTGTEYPGQICCPKRGSMTILPQCNILRSRTVSIDVCIKVFLVLVTGKMPTVVSPELYRTRFCEAMDKYFLLVPDRWTGLGQLEF